MQLLEARFERLPDLGRWFVDIPCPRDTCQVALSDEGSADPQRFLAAA
jgi:hypothetical protein